MPFETSLPALRPEWALELRVPAWVPGQTMTGARAYDATGQNFTYAEQALSGGTGGATQTPPVVSSGLFSGGNVDYVDTFRGASSPIRFGALAMFSWLENRWPMIPYLHDPADLGGLETPDWQRCAWLQFGLTVSAGWTGGVNDGCLLRPTTGVSPATPSWPGLAAGAGFMFFGFTGDGAGGVQYAAFDTAGALLEAVPMAGFNPAAWNLIDFILIGGSSGRAPTFELRCNGDSVAQREFGSAVLPYPPAGHWRVYAAHGYSPAIGQHYISHFHLRCGRFTPDGLELGA